MERMNKKIWGRKLKKTGNETESNQKKSHW